ncbi:hypothetical protein K3495_g9897 [Podosphaera aphanis]|nr:hypothetical protein K3495_g9897 [Podosphaera aphanis]
MDEEERHGLPQIMNMKDTMGNIHTEPRDKAKAMAQHFFPPPIIADVQDMIEAAYPDELTTISNVITQSEVEEILGNLPSDKAPCPDEIPNRLLKYCGKTLSKILVDLFNACLTCGYHPKRFKGSTTIVLKKPQKSSYDTPKAYRPIALLNTIGMVLEKLVANRISKAAEDHNILPENRWELDPRDP